MLKIIIFGGFGFVGSNIKSILNNYYDVISLSRKNGCDLNEEKNIINNIKKYKPDIIINCASHVGGLNYIYKNQANVFRDNSKIYFNLYEAVRKTKENIVIYYNDQNESYGE